MDIGNVGIPPNPHKAPQRRRPRLETYISCKMCIFIRQVLLVSVDFHMYTICRLRIIQVTLYLKLFPDVVTFRFTGPVTQF